jgi:hypothetical protein
LESANVVGYAETETVANDFVYRVMSFENIGGDAATFKLGQIQVGASDFAWWNNDYIATVAATGAQEQYYTWDPEANEGKGGWFECHENQAIDYDAPADNVSFPMNQAFFVFSANGESLTYSGSVLSGDSELYAVANDLTYTGNFSPVTITLGDIVIGAEDFAWWNNDYIATISVTGAQEQYYTWDPEANEGNGGWFECDENQTVDYEAPANDVEIPANQAFIFFTANGVSLNIPSAL